MGKYNLLNTLKQHRQILTGAVVKWIKSVAFEAMKQWQSGGSGFDPRMSQSKVPQPLEMFVM